MLAEMCRLVLFKKEKNNNWIQFSNTYEYYTILYYVLYLLIKNVKEKTAILGETEENNIYMIR